MLFSSMATSDSMLKTISDSVIQVIGVSDITISPTENTYVEFNGTEKYKDKIQYTVGELNGVGTFLATNGETIDVTVKGVNLDDLNKVVPYTLVNSSSNNSFQGNNVVLGDSVAQKYDLKVGDEIEVQIGEEKQKFTIWALASSKGYFSKTIVVPNLVIPKETLSTILKVQKKDNLIYIKLKDSKDKVAMVELLSKDYPSYSVKETFNETKLESQLSSISSIFFLLSCIVFFMSVFIIYSSFKVIVMERIPLIGTLRSIGASKRKTNLILAGESILYGVIGGLIGCGAGIGLLYILSSFLSDITNVGADIKLTPTVDFSFFQLLITFMSSVVLSLVSSLAPIIKISKVAIKDIILTSPQDPRKNKPIKILIPLFLLLISYAITLPDYGPDNNLFIGLALMFALLALVFFIPFVISFFVKLLEKLFFWFFGNIGLIATKNLRENKSLLNNIIMVSIVISILLTINTWGYNSVLSSLDSYKQANFQLRFSVDNEYGSFPDKLSDYSEIEDVYTDYEFIDVKVSNSDKTIGTIKAIDRSKFLNYWQISSDEDVSNLISYLDSDRNILVSTMLKSTLKLEKGSLIRLNTKSGEKEYKVVGFFKGFMNDSDYALVSSKYMVEDMQVKNPSVFYIKTSKDQKALAEQLKKDLKALNPKIYTKNEMQKLEVENNQNATSLMRGFCMLAMFIGLFGVINNLILSFIQRRQSLAMFRSVGMSKNQIAAMTLLESVNGGIIGSLMGIGGGLVLVFILSKVDNSPLSIEFGSLLLYMVMGIVVMFFASIIPAVKSTKLNLIESLRQN